MEEPSQSWYFSTMPSNRWQPSRAASPPVGPQAQRPAVRQVAFNQTKYGRDLLVDVEWVHDIPTFIRDAPHALEFFDITVITHGRGDCWLDGHRHAVRPGVVLFTTPGQVRHWETTFLDGICLFFMDTFIREFLHDESFIHRLPYFYCEPTRATVQLAPAAVRRMRARLTSMRLEFAQYRRDSLDVLRAQLHEMLIVLAREYATKHQVSSLRPTHETVSRYFALVDRDLTQRHRVADYAAELGVSPGHLSVLCRRYAGQSAKCHLDQALVARARRMLLYSGATAERIAASLGFGDPSYFSRFFRRATGLSPTEFRDTST